MRRIAIANQKGGVGKTTLAVNLAAAVAELGKSTLIVDLDPQANATVWLGLSTEDTLWDLFVDRKPLSITACPENPKIAFVAGCPGLVGVERELARNTNAIPILRDALQKLPRFDLCLIDTPPSLGLILLNAFAAADEIIIPVETRALAIQGLADLVDSIEETRELFNPKLRNPWILATRKTRTRLSAEIEEGLRDHFKGRVFKTTIRETVRIAEAPAHRQHILRYASSSPIADDFRDLAAEILKGK